MESQFENSCVGRALAPSLSFGVQVSRVHGLGFRAWKGLRV